jgi:spore coat protein U-like protein
LRTLLWGQSSNTLAGTGTGSAASVTVYGRVPMQQAAPAGGYSDIIVVTVEW